MNLIDFSYLEAFSEVFIPGRRQADSGPKKKDDDEGEPGLQLIVPMITLFLAQLAAVVLALKDSVKHTVLGRDAKIILEIDSPHQSTIDVYVASTLVSCFVVLFVAIFLRRLKGGVSVPILIPRSRVLFTLVAIAALAGMWKICVLQAEQDLPGQIKIESMKSFTPGFKASTFENEIDGTKEGVLAPFTFTVREAIDRRVPFVAEIAEDLPALYIRTIKAFRRVEMADAEDRGSEQETVVEIYNTRGDLLKVNTVEIAVSGSPKHERMDRVSDGVYSTGAIPKGSTFVDIWVTVKAGETARSYPKVQYANKIKVTIEVVEDCRWIVWDVCGRVVCGCPPPPCCCCNPCFHSTVGFQMLVQGQAKLAEPAIVGDPNKLTWGPTAIRTRTKRNSHANTTRLVRRAAYPDYSWIPSKGDTAIAQTGGE